MKKLWQKIDWIAGTVLGSAAFALGFEDHREDRRFARD